MQWQSSQLPQGHPSSDESSRYGHPSPFVVNFLPQGTNRAVMEGEMSRSSGVGVKKEQGKDGEAQF